MLIYNKGKINSKRRYIIVVFFLGDFVFHVSGYDYKKKRGNHLHSRAALTALPGWLPTGAL